MPCNSPRSLGLSFRDETTIPKIAIVAPKIRRDWFDPGWLAGTAANQRALLPARVIICFCPGRPSRYLSSHRSPQLQRCVTPNPLPERRNKSKGRGPRSLKKERGRLAYSQSASDTDIGNVFGKHILQKLGGS